MDFSWSDSQLGVKDEAIRFAQAELVEDVVQRDRDAQFSRDAWQRCADFGIQGMSIPRNYGGSERCDLLTAMLAMEGMGYGCRDLGLLFGLNAQMWTVQLPILRFGTELQKERYLPNLCNGEWIGAHAITERDSGSDAFSLSMHAERVDGGYRLHGKKCLVTLAPIADVALIFATTDKKLAKWGVTAFLVKTSSPGLHASRAQHKMGLRTVPLGELHLEGCFVDDEDVLGKAGAGFAISQHSLEYERCSILASQLGAMEFQLETAVNYAKDRRQFGQSIGKFQSVSNRIADMKMRLETARLLLYKVAWLKERGESAMMEAALLKLYLSESFVDSSLDAIRIHGGQGYLTDAGIERDLRDALGGVLYAGTSDIQRNIIAGLLGL